MTEQEAPLFAIEKLYIKDLSLEVPNAPAIYLESESPEVGLQLQTGVQRLAEDAFEVTLTVTVTTSAVVLAPREMVKASRSGQLSCSALRVKAGEAGGMRRPRWKF